MEVTGRVKNSESFEGFRVSGAVSPRPTCSRRVSPKREMLFNGLLPLKKTSSIRRETRDPCPYLGAGKQNGKPAPLFPVVTMPRGWALMQLLDGGDRYSALSTWCWEISTAETVCETGQGLQGLAANRPWQHQKLHHLSSVVIPLAFHLWLLFPHYFLTATFSSFWKPWLVCVRCGSHLSQGIKGEVESS